MYRLTAHSIVEPADKSAGILTPHAFEAEQASAK